MAAEHRRARRAAGAVVTVLVALAGGFGLLLFFVARDDAPVEEERTATTSTQAPGQATRADTRDLPLGRRRELRRALDAGNVVLLYGAAGDRTRLEALAADVAGGPFDPALAEAGQAVFVVREPERRGVLALAAGRRLQAGSASDPGLRRFAEAWLGRGAGG